jgi:hypothetical protein
MSGQGFGLDPVSIFFHILDHQLKESQLEVAREQLRIAYQRDGRDAKKLELYIERNQIEWCKFEQAQISYVFRLFNTMPKDEMAFTLRSTNTDSAFAYLVHWLTVGSNPEGWNAERLAVLNFLNSDEKKQLIEAFIAYNLPEALEVAEQLAIARLDEYRRQQDELIEKMKSVAVQTVEHFREQLLK